MEQKILKFKRIYTIFTVVMLIGFIDSIIIPIVLKSIPVKSIPADAGLIPLALFFLLGDIGIKIGFWFTNLWFVWGLVALIFNRLIKKSEN